MFNVDEAIQELTKRGYRIFGGNEPIYDRLSWHRKHPLEENLDFKAEAIEKIREQLNVGHLIVEVSDHGGHTVSSAYLLIRR